MRNRPGVPITFSMLVDGLIIQKGVKEKDIAIGLGINSRTIRRYRYGESNPERKNVIRIGVFLGLNLDEIQFLLYIAGYAYMPYTYVEYYYIDAIKKNRGVGKTRFELCDIELYNSGVPEEHWFAADYEE